MRLWIYVVRRLILLVPIIIGVMTITFVLVNALPPIDHLTAVYGTPPRQRPWLYQPTIPCSILNSSANPNAECTNPYYAALARPLGIGENPVTAWSQYMYRSLSFQWGTVSNHSTAGTTVAIAAGQPVTTVLAWFLPYTLELAILSLVIILIIAIPLGNLSAVYRNRPVDQASRVMSFSGYALPSFLLGSLLVMGFVLLLGASHLIHTPWCPSGETSLNEITGSWPYYSCFAGQTWPSWLNQGYASSPTGFPTVDALIHGQYWLAVDTVIRMLLPALVIAFGSIAILLRFVRNSMLEVMNLDFVRTARAKGVPESIVVKRHAGRNSLNVTVTVLGLTFAFFIGGFPIIEYVFNLHGIGWILALSIQQTQAPVDYGLIFGSTLLFTYIIVIANCVVDVTYALLDPRVRLG
jgi:ABC-type dipeptide/oligopeptide/nickel transport system permease component